VAGRTRIKDGIAEAAVDELTGGRAARVRIKRFAQPSNFTAELKSDWELK
jgi:hypothetical protein